MSELKAAARYRVGRSVALQGRPEEAIQEFRRVVGLYRDDPALALREQAAKACIGIGIALVRLDRREEAVDAYRDAASHVGADLASNSLGAQIYYSMAHALNELGHPKESVAAYRHVVDHYSDDPSVEVRGFVAMALCNIGGVMIDRGEPETAIASYREIVDRYRTDPAPKLREQTAKALYNIGTTLGNLDMTEEAIAALHQVVENYKEDHVARESVEKARHNISIELTRLGRRDDERR